ncbi:MAG: MBL fold metallo-hydrolase [Pseudorhodoplanes sp.]|jgi:ribonuclease BN (tRNA processing enzyme)|nr:MBL fold metallo-hydrolase [Pseudorhodoplanes sp.]
MRLQFIGSGDAFGSGGRFNTCLHLTGQHSNLLIDCGASSLVAMKKAGFDRGAIDTLLITHFHADHFGGVPFFILDMQFNIKRTKPLLIAGPPGLPGWFERAMSTAFPGERQLPFPLALREVEIGKDNVFPDMRVTPFHVVHDDRAGPCLAYRIDIEGKVICYSGDTEWTDTLINAAQGADLFVCECYTFEKPRKSHMSLSVLRQHLAAINAKRVMLTHLSEDMLSQRDKVDLDIAEDGMIVEF